MSFLNIKFPDFARPESVPDPSFAYEADSLAVVTLRAFNRLLATPDAQRVFSPVASPVPPVENKQKQPPEAPTEQVEAALVNQAATEPYGNPAGAIVVNRAVSEAQLDTMAEGARNDLDNIFGPVNR